MVWYQMFEYAIGHWLQKATEHMIGCVLCSPGCFSLFRGKALMDDNVMKKYTTRSDEARHYVQYDQGEDRWLCTLLLQRGYRVRADLVSFSRLKTIRLSPSLSRLTAASFLLFNRLNLSEQRDDFSDMNRFNLSSIASSAIAISASMFVFIASQVEYSAASDAYTHAPEGFNEFYNQRRRWVPSTIANIMDLLMDAKRTIKINDNISLPYISYQILLMGKCTRRDLLLLLPIIVIRLGQVGSNEFFTQPSRTAVYQNYYSRYG